MEAKHDESDEEKDMELEEKDSHIEEVKETEEEDTVPSSPPTVNVTSIEIDEHGTLVTDGLDFSVDFALSKPLLGGRWEMSFIVDSMHGRHAVPLSPSAGGESQDFGEGSNAAMLTIDSVDVSGVKPGALSNAGLLVAKLVNEGGGGVVTINSVVMVREEGEGEFVRDIFNPLE